MKTKWVRLEHCRRYVFRDADGLAIGCAIYRRDYTRRPWLAWWSVAGRSFSRIYGSLERAKRAVKEALR